MHDVSFLALLVSSIKGPLDILPKYKVYEDSWKRPQILSEERWNGYSYLINRESFWTKLCQKRGTFTPKRWPTPLDWRVHFCRFSVQIPGKELYFELNYSKKGVLFPPKVGLPPLMEGSPFADSLYKLFKRGLFWTNYRQKRGHTFSRNTWYM
jgi:hypothetical protein